MADQTATIGGDGRGDHWALPPAKPSPIRVCFTGRNRAGSWDVRGEQVSSRRTNWHASQTIDPSDVNKFDVFCFVKRPMPKLMEALASARKPMVLDAVDGWSQPDDNLICHNEREARELFKSKWQGLPQFHSIIYANRTMFQHLGRLNLHATYIYHHYNPTLPRCLVREQPLTVGYQGNEKYLGEWRDVIEEICARKELSFVVNPDDYSEIDIGFAARGREHSAFLTNSYKSNVKLANFYGTGTPCVVNARELSYHETDQGDVRFYETAEQLKRQINSLLSFETRKRISERFLAAARSFHIDRIVDVFEQYFLTIARLHREGRLS